MNESDQIDQLAIQVLVAISPERRMIILEKLFQSVQIDEFAHIARAFAKTEIAQDPTISLATGEREVQQLYEAFIGSGHCPKNPREAAQAIGQMRDAEEEIGRFHKLLLVRTGATQLEPVDVIMGRWLEQLAELERHHREHHNCTACEPCIVHRGLL